MKKLFELMDRR